MHLQSLKWVLLYLIKKYCLSSESDSSRWRGYKIDKEIVPAFKELMIIWGNKYSMYYNMICRYIHGALGLKCGEDSESRHVVAFKSDIWRKAEFLQTAEGKDILGEITYILNGKIA